MKIGCLFHECYDSAWYMTAPGFISNSQFLLIGLVLRVPSSFLRDPTDDQSPSLGLKSWLIRVEEIWLLHFGLWREVFCIERKIGQACQTRFVIIRSARLQC